MNKPTETRSLYEVLELTSVATPETVRKSYKRLILETHPDKLSPDATEADRELGEARFREVHAAFEVLSDPAKRRQYDMGLNFLRRTERQAEMSAKLMRERKAWEAEQQRRREERIRRMQEQQEAKQQRVRAMVERMQHQLQESQAIYDRRRTYEQELCRNYQQNHEMLIQSALARLDRMKVLEEELLSRMGQRRVELVIQTQGDAENMQPNGFLDELRKMHPEWETRRQAALARRAERMHSQDSISSEDSA